MAVDCVFIVGPHLSALSHGIEVYGIPIVVETFPMKPTNVPYIVWFRSVPAHSRFAEYLLATGCALETTQAVT